ncbi:MAG: NAD-dependent epimerase/dehydratase family protein [Flavobacteriales bacterium]
MDLVTGGTGLIGSHLLLELALRKRPIRALKREGSDLETVKSVFQYYRSEDGMALFSGIEWVDADLTDIAPLGAAMKGVERVFHSAGIVSYDPGDREKLLEFNAEGTKNLLELSLQEGVSSFAHVSSTSALGKPLEGRPVDEAAKWKVDRENSDYSISKYMAEREVWRAREEGLPVVIVNPCIVIGPGDPERSSSTLIGGVAKGNPFYPPGCNAFVDVRDVAGTLVGLMDGMDLEGERFVLVGEHCSFRMVMERIAEALEMKPPNIEAGRFLLEGAWRTEALLRMLSGRKPQITKQTARNGLREMHFSSEKARSWFGFSPRSIDEAIGNACAFYHRFHKEKAL